VKRQLRGILKKNIKIIKTGHDAVISLKKDAKKEISSDMLEQDLIAVLKKSKLL
jgi:RNase P protein component